MDKYKLVAKIEGGHLYDDLSQAIDAARDLTLELNQVVQVYRLMGETLREVGWKTR